MAAPNNPKGAKSDKEWRDALRLALHEEYDEDDGKKSKALRLVARAVVRKAIDGDVTAAKEIGDRLDGKATQVVEGNPEAPIEVIRRVIVRKDDETHTARPNGKANGDARHRDA